MSQTNRILRRNRRILSGIFAAGISKISLTDRRVKGFDTSCFTAVKRHLLRREEYYCYEFSYVLAGGRICRLSKHDVAGRLISARPTDSA